MTRAPAVESGPMNSPVVGLRVAGTIFGLVAAAHAARLATRLQIVAGGWEVPLGLNWAGLVVAGVLCLWLWKLSFGSSAEKTGS